jgi:hypothetical protein
MRPKIDRLIEIIKTTPKMRGMRIVYNEFDVKKYERKKWLDFWDKIKKEIDGGLNGGGSTGQN